MGIFRLCSRESEWPSWCSRRWSNGRSQWLLMRTHVEAGLWASSGTAGEMREPPLGTCPLMHPNSPSNPSFHLQLKPSPSLAPNPRCRHSSFDLGLNKPLTQPFDHTRGIISFLGRPGCSTHGLCRLGQSLNPRNSVRSCLYSAPWAVTAAREMMCESAGRLQTTCRVCTSHVPKFLAGKHHQRPVLSQRTRLCREGQRLAVLRTQLSLTTQKQGRRQRGGAQPTPVSPPDPRRWRLCEGRDRASSTRANAYDGFRAQGHRRQSARQVNRRKLGRGNWGLGRFKPPRGLPKVRAKTGVWTWV